MPDRAGTVPAACDGSAEAALSAIEIAQEALGRGPGAYGDALLRIAGLIPWPPVCAHCGVPVVAGVDFGGGYGWSHAPGGKFCDSSRRFSAEPVRVGAGSTR